MLKEGQSAMDGGLSFVEHDCMDAGGRVTQEQLPRDANQNDPTTKLNPKTWNLLVTEYNQCSGTRRANCLGRVFFGSVSFARAKEMNSP